MQDIGERYALDRVHLRWAPPSDLGGGDGEFELVAGWQRGDTGPGIPDEERSRIFDAFFQGRREQGGQVGGTGIGLSVVMECVQAHNGSVELLDSDEFPGAHFRIRIPQARKLRQHRMAANE